MNTNLNSSTLSSLDSKFTNFSAQSLTLIQPPNSSDPPTQEQKKSIAQIYIEQAQVYCQQGNWSKAILACKNALEIAPKTADAYKILGDILYRQGKPAEALGIYAKALMINPNLTAVYANLGTLYADRKDWQKALDYYQQAVILDPNLAVTYRNLAKVWEELGNTKNALECFCRAIDLDPTILKPEDYFSFGKELYQQGKLKEASIVLINGIKLNPDASEELALLVQILEELQEWQQAVIYYHQLISCPKSKQNYALSSQPKPIKKLLSGSKSKSFSHKMIAKNTRTDIPVLGRNLGQKLLPQVTSKAVEPDSTSTTVNLLAPNPAKKPDSARSWNNLGSVYAQKQQWAKAISCYQEALELEPNLAKAYRNLARVYQKTGEDLKAALYWYEAFTFEPNVVTAKEYFNLATTLLQYQQLDKAIACLHRTIELNPDCDRAHSALNQLLASRIE
jgi:tetratricopeptide (TPR) repeat protein